MATESRTMDAPGAVARAESLAEHWWVLLLEGVLLVIAGVLAIALPQVTTLAIDLLVGWALVIGGAVRLGSLMATRHTPGLWWSVLSGIVAMVVGGMLLARPLAGAFSITIVLITLFVIEGVFAIVLAAQYRRHLPNWGWTMFTGVVDLALAGLLLSGLPGTATWALGLFLGINLVTVGFAVSATALAARSVSKRVRRVREDFGHRATTVGGT